MGTAESWAKDGSRASCANRLGSLGEPVGTSSKRFGETTSDFEARLAKLRAMTKDDPAAWWDWVVDGIANNDSCSDDDVGLGYFATPIVSEVVTDVPGVLASEAILGGMTSSSVCFLWSDDPETGTEALRVRIAKATEAVRKVIAAIG